MKTWVQKLPKGKASSRNMIISVVLLLTVGIIMNSRIDYRHLSNVVATSKDKISLEDVDLNIKACGHWKCFSESKGNPYLGYQLIRNGDYESYRNTEVDYKQRKSRDFNFYVGLHTFAECVKTNYNISHIVGYPRVGELTEEMVNNITYPDVHPSVKDKKLFVPGEIMVLPVVYSEEYVQFHIPERDFELQKHMRKYIPQDLEYFHNFVASMKQLDLIISQEVNCLAMDFQGFISEKGIFHLFDVDTCGIPDCKKKFNFGPDFRKRLIEPLQSKLAQHILLAHKIKEDHYSVTSTNVTSVVS